MHNETSPMTNSSVDGLIGRTWKPTLSVVGSDGIPSIQNGGNVLRPYTELKLSFRLPPTVDCNTAVLQSTVGGKRNDNLSSVYGRNTFPPF